MRTNVQKIFKSILILASLKEICSDIKLLICRFITFPIKYIKLERLANYLIKTPKQIYHFEYKLNTKYFIRIGFIFNAVYIYTVKYKKRKYKRTIKLIKWLRIFEKKEIFEKIINGYNIYIENIEKLR